MLWFNLINETNKVEAKAKIEENILLDQQYRKGKQLLKISLNSWDN